MTTLTGEIEQDFTASPRLTVVRAPRLELSAQDLVDTLRKIEDSFQAMSYNRLLDASGKEGLGGGVSVGITYKLRDTQIQFEDRTDPARIGTITTDSSAPISGRVMLIDTGATFVTAGVNRGSLVINFTDRSICSVVSVVSETELLTKIPANGTDNSFDIGDVYHVIKVDTVVLSGGNSTAVDDSEVSISSVVPSIGTYVVLEKSTSASVINADVASFWNAQTSDYQASGSFGEFVRKKLLTVVGFLGLK